MTDEMNLILLAAHNEFEWLAKKIVQDGRDPEVVAFAMAERLVKSAWYYQTLWSQWGESGKRG